MGEKHDLFAKLIHPEKRVCLLVLSDLLYVSGALFKIQKGQWTYKEEPPVPPCSQATNTFSHRESLWFLACAAEILGLFNI